VDTLLSTLCDLLDDEVERQENVLAVCNAQRDAVLARDLDALAARTSALELLIRESIHAQAKRHETLRPIVEHFGLEPNRQTMTHLIEVSPEPWKTRLHDIQVRMRLTVDKTRAAVRVNAKVTRQSKRMTDGLIRALRQEHQRNQGGYTDLGAENAGRIGSPVLMDQRG
jgi:hypothetical protein